MSSRPVILVSNDDGIEAKGIQCLVQYLKDFGDIYVVAPELPQSGKSSAITVEVPLRVTEVPNFADATAYKINGTPVDCAKLAMHTLLPHRPDYIVSGINHGANTGISSIYSGTMGVAFEGCIAGIPSVGFSLLSHEKDADFSPCEFVVKKVMTDVITNGLPDQICLNVNIPDVDNVKGIKAVSAARGRWTDEFEQTIDAHKKIIYWLTGKYKNYEPENKATDLYILDDGYASVVPCRPDQTVFNYINDLNERLDVHF